jgi:proline iminopeptidase
MPGGTVTVDGARIAYEQWGRGKPLVCLHGGMGIDSSYLRTDAVVGLASELRRVVIFDQRGHGASDRSPTSEYSHDRWVADAHAVTTELAGGRFALLGHSYGGFLALEFALRHRDRLSHLLLVGTSAGPVPAQVPLLDNDVETREFFRACWPRFFPGPDKHWKVFNRLTFSRDPFNAAFRRELPGYDLREQVRGIDVPTLLIVGEDDPYRPAMEWLGGRLPRARLEVIPGAGHLPFLDAPEPFSAAVAEFLGDGTIAARTESVQEVSLDGPPGPDRMIRTDD